MNFEFNYYEILGVQPNANKDEIKKAYDAFKKDKYEKASKWQRSQVEEAYKVLSDNKLKEEYDAHRANKGKEPTKGNGKRKDLNKILKKIKEYAINNKVVCVLIGCVLILGVMNICLMHRASSLQSKLHDVEYEMRSIRYSKIDSIETDIARLKVDVKEISDVQSSIYGLSRNSRTTSYNIDQLKDAHNDLVNYIKCIGKSYCYPRGGLVTLY